jgi:allantoin racemase
VYFESAKKSQVNSFIGRDKKERRLLMKIRYHHPMLYSDSFEGYDKLCRQGFESLEISDLEVEHTWSRRGTQAVQYQSCDILNTLETVEHVLDAEEKGFDGVIIGCSLDIGLKASREVAKIPVVSSMEAAMFGSCIMGRKFCIISFGERARVRQEQLIDEYGLRKRATNVRAFEMTLEELGEALKTEEKKKELREIFMEEARKAVTEEQAEVIIPGCGILGALCILDQIATVDAMQEVPVIDTFVPALKLVEMLVMMKQKLGIDISRRGLYYPPPQEVISQVRAM